MPAAKIWVVVMLATLHLLYAQAAIAQTSSLQFAVSPSTIPAGRSRTVRIKTTSGADLSGFEVEEPLEDTGVVFEEPGGRLADGNTAIVLRLSVDEDADEQVFPLSIVKKKDGQVIETYTVDLTISAFTPKALQKQTVPTGLDYEVDSLVQPMAYKSAKDIFGRRVADQYYVVVVGLGNNTGFDLQINKIAFRTLRTIQVPEMDKNGDPIFDNEGKVKMRNDLLEITAIDRSLVRSGIERDQNFGTRALALNLIGGVGTLTTGFLPFFHALGPRANFSSFTSVINGQLKDGFTLAVPDLIIRHLNRLDSSLVMDQDFVLPNNSERNTVVFVPRQTLGLEGKERDNLMKVREILGDLMIVGRRIRRFSNRQIVLRSDRPSREPSPFNPESRAPGSSTPIAIDSVTPAVGALSASQDVLINGSGFTPGTAVKVKFGDRQTTGVALTPTMIKATVPPNAVVTPVDVEVIVDETHKDKLEKGYAYIDELNIERLEPSTGPTSGELTIKILGRGFISGAQVKFGDVAATDVAVANDHNSITVKLPTHAAGQVDITVRNPDGKSQTKSKGFTYKP